LNRKRAVPWYRRTFRWSQTNLTEIDPVSCDVEAWRRFWRSNGIQGVIVNAAGIVAYYPSQYSLQYRAKYLGGRDLLGEFTSAAKADGLTVLARMDINRATSEFYEAHPDWFAVDQEGRPYMAGDRYLSCINSGYYKEYTPDIFREIIERYEPDGFTDNSWAGIQGICYCGNCRASFREYAGCDLPGKADYDDKVFLQWLKWSRRLRTDNWKLFNRVIREQGGKDCLWLGMIHGNPFSQGYFHCDLNEVLKDATIVMLDSQGRDAVTGFEQNGITGGMMHGLIGWDNVLAESMSNYARLGMMFRRASNPPEEARLWMAEGIAAGISPWTHFVGGAQEDRRMFAVPVPVLKWHRKNEKYLYNRKSLASIGLVWSQDNALFYGKDKVDEVVGLPFRGMARGLTRSRRQFVPVHIDRIGSPGIELKTLILPDIAVMTGAQLKAVCGFVRRGGNIIYSCMTGVLDGWGNLRKTFPLDEVCRVKRGKIAILKPHASAGWDDSSNHTYLRLPEKRHEILAGFEDTDILPFGGLLHAVEPCGLSPVATYIPPFPIYPPEFSYMDVSSTDLPVILAGETGFGGRAVYLAGDIDRSFGRTMLPDLGDLLEGCFRWVCGEEKVRIHADAYLDCKAYRQEDRVIVHLVNLTGAGQWPAYVEHALPTGKVVIELDLEGFMPKKALMTVSGLLLEPIRDSGKWRIEIENIQGHEMVVIE
jgi:hypothetical protein